MISYPKKIDLHMHTTVSDGTDSPEEIIQRVKAAGIDMFSITDHDAIKGCIVVRSLLKEAGLSFIPGVEFSCKDENGKYHILGYGYDPQSDAIKEVIDTGHTYRISKLKKRIDFLKKEYGFSFSDEDLSALYKLDNPGKPHIGNLMVKYGYAPSKEIAIQTYVDKFHAGSEYVRPEQAIKGILAAGGVPVLAHPSYGRGDELILSSEMELRLRRLISFGLEGVEAFYSGFTPKLEEEILSFAEKFGLYVTAGSDYHGKNKLVQLGDTNLSSDAPYPTGLKRFLERVLG
ncbi:MAG: PHP domain-containing protein [Clostridia bacterium]|nr:PHP domain-containing protein [Clostridia bacterium]